MKRLVLPLLFLLGCTRDAEEDAFPPVDALPERNEVLVAAETIAVGAIALTLEASVDGDRDACVLHTIVKQTVSDDGPAYERLGDHWTLERGYVHRGGGVWSAGLAAAGAPGPRLEGTASGAPRVDGEVEVVVRLVAKDGRVHYLAKRDVPIRCAD